MAGTTLQGVVFPERLPTGTAFVGVHSHVWQRIGLTEFINLMVLESQLPHKTVNSMYLLVIVNNELTILWGSRLRKTISFMHCVG